MIIKKSLFTILTFSFFLFLLSGMSAAQEDFKATAVPSVELCPCSNQAYAITVENTGTIASSYRVLANEELSEWIKFNDKLKKCVEQKNDQITYMNHPLHLSEFNNKAQKVGNLYPYFNQLNKEKVVKKVLTSKYNGVSIYSILNRNHIRLQIEPGRSSLDQSGITVARVMFRKQDIFGNWLVGLNMGFTQLLSSSSEFAVDPVVVYKNFSSLKEYVDVNFVGNYCMERDVIQRRIIRLNRLPKIGDLVIFINTAGYMSHFLATNSHLFEPPYNIFIDKNHNLQVDKYR